MTVRMGHPDVTAVAEVPESAVPHWQGRGWTRLPDEPTPVPADEASDKPKDKPRGSRRRSSEGDE